MTLRLRAPIEFENLLPYNLQYRIFDKQLDQNWSSYLRQGGLMPVHSVELDHLILLNVNLPDTCTLRSEYPVLILIFEFKSGFKPSDWVIINTGANGDFDIEKQIHLQDPGDRKLSLRLNYMLVVSCKGL
jgi:vacuolar protein sorting-associated protein 13A/C